MTDVFESWRFWVRSLCVVALGVTAAAQAPLEFEVASIKRNTTNTVMPGPVSSVTSGQYWMSNVTAGTIILRGYPVDRPMDMLNLPDWVSGERYDILAKGKPGATADEQQRMWRALLADRFKLQAHYETRTQQGYHLVFARADRRLGSQLQPSSLDCTQSQPPINRETVAQAKGAAAFAMQRCSFMMVARAPLQPGRSRQRRPGLDSRRLVEHRPARCGPAHEAIRVRAASGRRSHHRE